MLTDTAIRNAKPGSKVRKLFDGRGLYLLVTPSGSRGWRLKYRYAGREKLISFGTYPEVTLKTARAQRDSARALVAVGRDPSVERTLAKAKARGAGSFEEVAREWFTKFATAKNWSAAHAATVSRQLERDVIPWIGARPVSGVTPAELLTVLRRIEQRGAADSAHRIHQVCGQVFRYAVATGRAERDPSADLKGALPAVRRRHFAAITDPGELGALLRAIGSYKGGPIVRAALRILPYVFVRSAELRRAEWSELDLEGATWRIPASRMKMGIEHLVPLSKPVVEILRDELWPLAGVGRYVFPNVRWSGRALSENALTAALRSLGYPPAIATIHGFRSTASTLLRELGYPGDLIELQLAHAPRDRVRAAYDRSTRLAERRAMIEQWASYLDDLRYGVGQIISLRRTAPHLSPSPTHFAVRPPGYLIG
jgi:integrase